MIFEFFRFFPTIFLPENLHKLIVLRVPQPREYDITIQDIEILFPSLGVVKFDGLGLDL